MGERGGGEENTSVGIFFQMEIQIFWRVYDHARARSGGFCRRRRGGVARPAAVPTKSGRGPEMRRGMRRKHARHAPTPQPPPPDPLWIRAHFHFRGPGGVDSLMTGMSSSSAMCSKSLKPSMSGMCTSESTMSKSSLRSRRVFSASAPREKVVTALLSRERVARQPSGSIEGCRGGRREGAASAGRFGNRARYFYNTRMHRLARSRQRYGRS